MPREAKPFLTKEGGKQKAYIMYAQGKYSNGETSLQYFEALYNLDTQEYDIVKWNELENVKYLYDFFKKHEREFE